MYDLIIIGAGISSLYYLYLTKPQGKILVLEKKPFIGGRIQTKEFESGSLRFNKNHKNLLNLIKKFNLETLPLPIQKRIFYNNHLQKLDNNLHSKFIKTLNNISSNNKYSSFNFSNALQDFLPQNEINIFQTWFGYDQKFFNMNAQILAQTLQKNYMENEYFILEKGLSSIVHNLFQNIKNVEFKLGEKVIFADKNIIKTSLKTYKSKKIIFAIPPHKLIKINPLFTPLTGKVAYQTLNRIYAYFENDSWFPKFSIYSDLTIKQILPIKNNLIMISYTTNIDSQQMIRLEMENLLWDFIKKDVEKILNKKIPKPLWIKQNYWMIGTHYWKPLSNPIKDIKESYNMNIIGEAFSMDQGWIEGALNNVKGYIKHTQKENFITMEEVKKNNYVVLYNNVYDITDWIDTHPGGDVIKNAQGIDGTKMFESVGHDDFALECMQKYFIGKIKQ